MAAGGEAGGCPAPSPAHRRGAGLSGAPRWLIRRLLPGDLPALRPVRLRALRDHPEAFGASYEEELGDPDGMGRLIAEPPGAMLGGFVPGGPVQGGPATGGLAGTIGLTVSPRTKLRHKGHLSAVYVAPEQRGTGLAQALLDEIILYARAGRLLALTLSVTVGNEAARRLYLRAGFRSCGVEPGSLRIGGALFDEELMVLPLD